MNKQEQRKLKIKTNQEKKMKHLKNLFTTVTLMAVLMIGASTTKAGLLVSDFTSTSNTSCTNQTEENKTNWGVIVSGFTGVIVAGFTGVIVVGATDDTDTNCGILMTDD